MVERLPKDCAVVVDNLAKALGHDMKLGVKIECGKLGNRFKLVVADKYGKFDQTVFYVKVAYDDVNVPEIKNMLNVVWPDFMLKPTGFMLIDRLVSDFKLDKEQLSTAILKGIRSRMKKSLSEYYNHGVCIYLKNCHFCKSESDQNIMPRFKSFNEFLVWVDLNVK